ncbi:beta-ketoacyl synthase N-terminal-like domain-containing protein [Rhodospirillum sp. A1_3_36]|uniref:type I polyketide synthase n=1 Tax=Rhodospirillum sp. A1_3_36 TaxID=3391666 RepID=UPI0039A66AD6
MSDEALRDDQDSIAIIGMAAHMPGAADLDAFWRNLRDGVDSVRTFTEAELLEAGLDSETVRHPRLIATKGHLDGADQFDAAFFGIAPREAELMDPQHRLMMECAWQAMEHAGYDAETVDGRVAIYTSAGMNTYLPLNILTNPGLAESIGGFQLSIFNDKDFVPTRIAYAMNVTGPGVDIGTACSSSLVSLHIACQSLLTYQSDMALVGGVTVHLPQIDGHIHEDGSAYAPDGRCRPFDATTSGLVDGNGLAAVVLKRLADALADGDTIHAVVKGTAINNDGSMKLGYTAPSIEGQAAVILEAQSVANCPPETIGYIEAHGTATPLGDPVEVAALTRAFRAGTNKTGFCGLGAVKSNIGHVDKAAGLAGLIKTALALKNEAIPPTLHFQAPNPKLNLPETPFFVVDRLRPWPRKAGAPRRAGISSFGVGGTNAHAILEEAPQTAAGSPSRPVQIVTLSARSEAALRDAAGNLAAHLETTPSVDFADACHTLRRGRRAFPVRYAFACRSVEEAIRRLKADEPGHACERPDQSVAFLFPGQGSQYPGMARDLYEREPLFRAEIDTCATLLEPQLGRDIRSLLLPPNAEQAAGELTRTALAQPVLFAVEYALARLLMSWGITPAAMIGHSLGEYVAACLAEVFSLPDALTLITARGRLMQSMAPGVMLAVPLSEAALRPRLDAGIDLAAVNAPDLCVVAGTEEALATFQAKLAADGVTATRLHTSHAFHSAAMEPAVDPFKALFTGVKLNPPRIPFLSNLLGDWITDRQATNPDYWAAHLRQPVRFADGLARLLRDRGPLPLVEVGPGRTLATFAARTGGEPAQPCIITLPQPGETRDAQETLLSAVAELWTRGVAPDWSAFQGDETRRRVPLPTYPFQRQSYWVEPGGRAAEPAPTAISGKTSGGAKRPDIADWFHLPSWRAAATPSSRFDGDEVFLLFHNGSQLADHMARDLTEGGRKLVTVQFGDSFKSSGDWDYLLKPTQPDDFTALFDDLFAKGRMPRHILYLWSEDSHFLPNHFDMSAHLQVPLSIAQALDWMAPEQPIDLLIIGHGLRDLPNESAAQMGKASIIGLVETLPWEQSAIRARAIDIPTPPEVAKNHRQWARRLIRELNAPESDRVVALRGGNRWVHETRSARLESSQDPLVFDTERACVLTGGMSEIGLGFAQRLNALGVRKIALIDVADPTSPPPPGLADVTASLSADGGEVLTMWLDEGFGGLRAAFETIRNRFDGVGAVIHVAEMNRPRPPRRIKDIDPTTLGREWEDVEKTFNALSSALVDRNETACLVMSSLAADIGGPGRVIDAAIANAVDAFALRLGWSVLNWDQCVAEETARTSSTAITPGEAADLFERALRQMPGARVVIATNDPSSRLAAHREGQRQQAEGEAAPTNQSPARPAAAKGHRRPDLPVAHLAPRTDEERTVAALWEEVLGIDGIGVNDNFFDLGGHSLLAAQLVSRLRQSFRVEMELDALFTTPTIVQLTESLIEKRVDTEIGAETRSGAGENLSALLDQIESMSEEEVAALLASGELPPELLSGGDPK